MDCTNVVVETPAALSKIAWPSTEIVHLSFSPNHTVQEICENISILSQKKKVAALSPEQILTLREKSGLRMLDICAKLSEAGLSFCEGKLTCEETDLLSIDEYFGVVFHLNRFGILSSAWLPNSFSDAAKIEHLFRIREFDDRTHSITHVLLEFQPNVSENSWLKIVALTRLMLDFTKHISIADYGLEQSKHISSEWLKKGISLGVNLTY
ncbi:hypothetical protein [Chloroherpeton thalassium]|uniref:hypothetical protein n=1 Tax=Chloroherpeton thalassium TaxID=100716 RepID=UPI00059ED2FE|nr:hypothetical protein [Chloroherpeton thalassium]